jgi:hypothetical protein
MSPRRFTAFAALCGTVILGASVAAGFAGFRSHVVENVTAPIQASRSISASTDAETVDVPQATAKGHDTVPAADVTIDELASLGSHPTPPSDTATERLAAEGEPGSVENDGRQATNSVETLDDCSMAEICVDHMAEADAPAMAMGSRSTSSAQRARRVWNDSVQAKSCGSGSMCMARSLGSGDRISIKILRTLRRWTAKNMPFTTVGQKRNLPHWKRVGLMSWQGTAIIAIIR